MSRKVTFPIVVGGSDVYHAQHPIRTSQISKSISMQIWETTGASQKDGHSLMKADPFLGYLYTGEEEPPAGDHQAPMAMHSDENCRNDWAMLPLGIEQLNERLRPSYGCPSHIPSATHMTAFSQESPPSNHLAEVASPSRRDPGAPVFVADEPAPTAKKTRRYVAGIPTKELKEMPKLRNLPYRVSYRQEESTKGRGGLERGKIITMVGELAENPCTLCENGQGPFEGCFAVVRDGKIYTCANCTYLARTCSLTRKE